MGSLPGRLYVARDEDEVRIVDIALLPDFCNRGVGDDAAARAAVRGGEASP